MNMKQACKSILYYFTGLIAKQQIEMLFRIKHLLALLHTTTMSEINLCDAGNETNVTFVA